MPYFVFKIQSPCADCGEAIVLDGPLREASCAACSSRLEIEPALWQSMLGLHTAAHEFGLVEGRTRGSSLTSGELRFLIRWGPERPRCPGCAALLEVDSVPSGGMGTLSCSACGFGVPTAPPPAWLAAVAPKARQLFAADLDTGAPSVASPVVAANAARPVLFTCPQCGANLKVGSDSPRILTCTYCDTDLFLPDPLWRALHPAQKRRSWWVRFDD